jgi:hypothetical protein
MKKSSMVVLVLSGGLITGCNSSHDSWREDARSYTNNHYTAGRGYYHAPYRAWFPYPYNHFDATRGGYYHGGQYTPSPHLSSIAESRPLVKSTPGSSTRRGGFSSSRSGLS